MLWSPDVASDPHFEFLYKGVYVRELARVVFDPRAHGVGADREKNETYGEEKKTLKKGECEPRKPEKYENDSEGEYDDALEILVHTDGHTTMRSAEFPNRRRFATINAFGALSMSSPTFGGSSNGRTTAFEAVYLGSSPSPPANHITQHIYGF